MRRALLATVVLHAAVAAAQPAPAAEPDPRVTYSVPIDPSIDGISGPADAKVTIVVASDYACPFCEKVRAPLAELRQKYGKDLRIVERQFVVHPAVAQVAALGACAATRQHAFAQLDALLWDRFKAHELDDAACLAGGDPLTTCKFLAADVKRLKLDAARFTADMAACKQPLTDAQAAWAANFHTRGIPTMFVNGRWLQGAQPTEKIAQVVDEELAKQTAVVAHGGSAATYYDEYVVRRGAPDLAASAAAPPAPPRAQPDPATVYSVPVLPAIDAIVGGMDAKVTLIVASDYACPYCERIRPTLDALVQRYASDLRIVHRQFIVHPQNATAFALAACAAAKQGAWEQMDAALWDHYKAREYDTGACWTGAGGCPFVDATAKQLGLDRARLYHDMAACKQPIADAQAQWSKDLGMSGIPAVWINGRSIVGAQPVDNYVKVIDEELAKATQRIHAGAKAATYYATFVVGRGVKALPGH